MTSLVHIVSVDVQFSGASIASRITGGTIELRGDLIALEYSREEDSTRLQLFKVTNKDGKAARTEEGSGHLDTMEHDIDELKMLWALPVGLDSDGLFVLLVQETEPGSDTYRRIGCGELSTVNVEIEYFDTKYAGKKLIKLV